MDLSDLPDSVLLNIFEYLPIRTRLQLRRVCSKWFNLLYDFSIWKNINLSDESLFTSRVNEDIVIEWILRWGNTIKELNFKEAKWISEKTITAVVRNCPDLQGLNIEGCFQISDPALVRISFQCRRLESVNLFLSGVSDVGFDCLAMNCPELNRIKLGSRGSCYKMLQSLYKHSSKLKHISIHDVIPFDEVEPVVDDTIITKLTKCFSGLQTIDFTWCCFISDDALVALSQCCLCLSKLIVRECHKITDRGVTSVLKHCQNLRHLHLERLYNVSDRSCGAAFGEQVQLTKLRYLKIVDTAVTDLGIAKLAEKSPNLETLQSGEYCFNPYNIIGDCIPVISRSCKMLKRLKVFSAKMNDDYLCDIGNNLHELRDLYLGDCSGVTSTGLWKVIKNCRMLVKLDIKDCPHLDDDMLGLMVKYLNHLKDLEIYGCKHVTANAIMDLVTCGSHCTVRM